MKTKVQMASQKKSRGRFCRPSVGLVEKMLRCAMGSTTPSDARNSSAYMNHATTAPAKPPSMSATMYGMQEDQGTRPTMHWAKTMAGFMQTAPPKMNRATEMPKDQVVIANMWPEPWYLAPLRTVSQ